MPDSRNSLNDALKYAQISGMLIGPMLAFGAIGFWLDRRYGTKPWFLLAGLIVNVVLCVFNLVPIPGLDGSKIVGQVLSGRAQHVYRNLDEYLPLFMLLVFFILAGLTLTFVRALGNALCRLITGQDCIT